MFESNENFAVNLKRVLRRIYIGKSERIGVRQIIRLLFLFGFTISLAAAPFQSVEVRESTAAESSVTDSPSVMPSPSETPSSKAETTEKDKEEEKVKETPVKTNSSSEKLAGFDARHIRSFKTIVTNIRAYVSAVENGSTVKSSQLCDLLDENYNSSIRGVYTRSVNMQIQDLLDFAKDSMYAGVVDCTRGFRKGRIDLIGDSVTEFVAASKYLDGLVLVSQVK